MVRPVIHDEDSSDEVISIPRARGHPTSQDESGPPPPHRFSLSSSRPPYSSPRPTNGVVVSGPDFQPLPPEVEAANFLILDNEEPEPAIATADIPTHSVVRPSAPADLPSSSRALSCSRNPSGGLALMFSYFYGSFLRSSCLQRNKLRYKEKKHQEKCGDEPNYTLLDEASDYDAEMFARYIGGQGSGHGFDGSNYDGSGTCF